MIPFVPKLYLAVQLLPCSYCYPQPRSLVHKRTSCQLWYYSQHDRQCQFLSLADIPFGDSEPDDQATLWTSNDFSNSPLIICARQLHNAFSQLHHAVRIFSATAKSLRTSGLQELERDSKHWETVRVVASWCVPSVLTLIPPTARLIRRFTFRLPHNRFIREAITRLMPPRGVRSGSRVDSRSANGSLQSEGGASFYMPCLWDVDSLTGELTCLNEILTVNGRNILL